MQMQGRQSPATRGCAARLRAKAGLRGPVLPGTETGWITQRCFSSPTSITLVRKFRLSAMPHASAVELVPKSRQRSLLFQGQLFEGPELERGKGTGRKVSASHSTGEDTSLCREDRVQLPETCSLVPFLVFPRPAHKSCSWVSMHQLWMAASNPESSRQSPAHK